MMMLEIAQMTATEMPRSIAHRLPESSMFIRMAMPVMLMAIPATFCRVRLSFRNILARMATHICIAPVRIIHGHRCFGGRGLRRTRAIARSIRAPEVKRSAAKKDGAKKSLAVFMTTKLKPQNSHKGRRAWNGVLLPVILTVSVSDMVQRRGLEPLHLSAPEPKSGASTNSATSARKECVFYCIYQDLGRESLKMAMPGNMAFCCLSDPVFGVMPGWIG